jgi:hypothetical protein
MLPERVVLIRFCRSASCVSLLPFSFPFGAVPCGTNREQWLVFAVIKKVGVLGSLLFCIRTMMMLKQETF